MGLKAISGFTQDTDVNQVTLGTVRSVGVAPHVNFKALARACVQDGLVPNPNHSPGCSPIIRAFLVQTGLPFGISHELFNDGGITGHLHGNALDVVAAKGSPNADAAIGVIAETLSPHGLPLFTRVVHKNATFPSEDIQFPGAADAALYNKTTHMIHLESNAQTMLSYFNSYADESGPARLFLNALNNKSPFGGRNVYYDDELNTNGIRTNAQSDGPGNTNFW